MNIVTESHIAGKPIGDKPRKRPVRMVRWFIIVGLLLALLVGGLVWFNSLPRQDDQAVLRQQQAAADAASASPTAKSEAIPNLLTAVGDLAAVHQVNVTSDVSGRITDIMFTAGASVKAGTPLVQLFDAPEQGDLANFKAQATVAQLSLDRAKQLAARQFGPQATVDAAQATFDQANAGIAKTEAHHFAEAGARAVRRRTRRPSRSRSDSILTAGTQIVSLTDLSMLYANFTVTEKDSAPAQGRADRAHRGRCLSGPHFRGQDHHHRAADRDRYAQHSRAGDDRQSGSHPQARHVHDHHGGAAGQAAGHHRSRNRGRLHAVWRFGLSCITEKKADDGKTSLTAVRTFVQTGNRIDGRAEILNGLKAGDRVVAVGQLKLQSGAAVTISTDPPPPIPANPPRY